MGIQEAPRAKAQEGWEERLAEAKAEITFEFTARIRHETGTHVLAQSEYERLWPKLNLISQHAARLAIGMLKGTIKYAGDHYSLEMWRAERDDDRADGINYDLLLADAEAKEHELIMFGAENDE